jgi:hypothetical protein
MTAPGVAPVGKGWPSPLDWFTRQPIFATVSSTTASSSAVKVWGPGE